MKVKKRESTLCLKGGLMRAGFGCADQKRGNKRNSFWTEEARRMEKRHKGGEGPSRRRICSELEGSKQGGRVRR